MKPLKEATNKELIDAILHHVEYIMEHATETEYTKYGNKLMYIKDCARELYFKSIKGKQNERSR